MKRTAHLVWIFALCIVVVGGTHGQQKKEPPVPDEVTKKAIEQLLKLDPSRLSEPTPSNLVTSDTTVARASLWGAEVLRAVAVSEPDVKERSAAHRSTAMRTSRGTINGGGMTITALCQQTFTVKEVLAGSDKREERLLVYSYLERALGFPLPSPRRPVARGEKIVLVLGPHGDLVKAIPDTEEHHKSIAEIARNISARPAAANILMKRMDSFLLTVEYHGPKPDAFPSLHCTTNREVPEKLPTGWKVVQNLSQLWAYQAVEHLVQTDVLKPETIRAERQRAKQAGPHYLLTVSAAGTEKYTYHLGWGKAAHDRIEALARAMEYEREAFAPLLKKLKEETPR